MKNQKENALVEAANPHLSTIKTMGLVLKDLVNQDDQKKDPDPVWNQLEQARFQVYKALSKTDVTAAREWFSTLRAVQGSIDQSSLTKMQHSRLERAIGCIGEIIENRDRWGA